MKSKKDDAKLIAEAYAQVEPLEVQEEGLGALAGGIGKVAGKVAGKAAKTGLKLAGKAAMGAGKAAVKGTFKGLDKAGQLADKGISKLAGDEEEDGEHKKPDADGDGVPDWADKKPGKDDHAEDGEDDFPAADHDAPKGGIGSRSMDREELKVKVAKAKAEGGIDSSDAAQIMRSREDAEHAAPIEVDMSQNPAPESLEVSADVDVEEEPSVAIVAPSIQPSVEEPMMNHQDRSEMEMAKAELYKLEKYSFKLGQMLDHLPALEGWTASKITKAADYLSSVYHKLDYDLHGDENGIKSEDHEGH